MNEVWIARREDWDTGGETLLYSGETMMASLLGLHAPPGDSFPY